MGAPRGNRNAARGTAWRDAIRKAVLRDGKLDALAQALVARALEGDIAALREIGDRLDGKARQSVEFEAQQAFLVSWLPPSGDELQRKLDAALEGRAEPKCLP